MSLQGDLGENTPKPAPKPLSPTAGGNSHGGTTTCTRLTNISHLLRHHVLVVVHPGIGDLGLRCTRRHHEKPLWGARRPSPTETLPAGMPRSHHNTHHLHAVVGPIISNSSEGFEEGEHGRLAVPPTTRQQPNLDPAFKDGFPQTVIDCRPKSGEKKQLGITGAGKLGLA